MTPAGRATALAFSVALLAVAALLLPLRRLPAMVEQLGVAAPLVAVVAAAALLAALVPRTAITVACGAVFGPLAGAGVSYAAAMLAAVATFGAGRTLGREMIAARAGRRLRQLDGWVAQRGTLAVVVVRVLPISGYGLVGYAYGASAVRTRHYLLGSAIGAVPSSFTHALVGAAVVSPDRLGPATVAPALLSLLLGAAAALYWRRSGPVPAPAP